VNGFIGREHQPFYDHLLAGGKVWRNDPLNHIQEVLHKSNERFKEDLTAITMLGYSDLMVIPKEHEKFFYDYLEICNV